MQKQYAIFSIWVTGMGEGNIDEDNFSLVVTSFWMLFGNIIFFQWCLALVKASLGMERLGLLHNVADRSRSIIQWISTVFGLTPQALVILLIILWTTFGICIGVLVEEWTFIKSLNFAIGGMTTTGSQLVSNTTLSNVLTTRAVGVPLLSIVSSVVLLPDSRETEETKETEETEETNKLVKKNRIQF